MYSILAVFLLTVLAAGMWHGGRVWLRGDNRPAWLRNSVDQKSGVWVALLLVPVLALLAMGIFALASAAIR